MQVQTVSATRIAAHPTQSLSPHSYLEPDQTDASRRARYEAGATLEQIALDEHTSAKTVRASIIRAGGTIRPRLSKGRKYTKPRRRVT